MGLNGCGSDEVGASPWRPLLWPQVRHMLTGQIGHSSPDAALSVQARWWALPFRTPQSHPTRPTVPDTRVTSQFPPTHVIRCGGCALFTVIQFPAKFGREKPLSLSMAKPDPSQRSCSPHQTLFWVHGTGTDVCSP